MDLGQDICMALSALALALLIGFFIWLLRQAFKNN